MTILIEMTTDNAKLLARALRCVDGNATDETLSDLSELGFQIGALLGMTTDTDETDEIDELPAGKFRANIAGELVSVHFGD